MAGDPVRAGERGAGAVHGSAAGGQLALEIEAETAAATAPSAEPSEPLDSDRRSRSGRAEAERRNPCCPNSPRSVALGGGSRRLWRQRAMVGASGRTAPGQPRAVSGDSGTDDGVARRGRRSVAAGRAGAATRGGDADQLRAAQKEGYERIAVVCGAWHAPALAKPPPARRTMPGSRGCPNASSPQPGRPGRTGG